MTLRDVHIRILGTYEDIILLGKGIRAADGIKVVNQLSFRIKG